MAMECRRQQQQLRDAAARAEGVQRVAHEGRVLHHQAVQLLVRRPLGGSERRAIDCRHERRRNCTRTTHQVSGSAARCSRRLLLTRCSRGRGLLEQRRCERGVHAGGSLTLAHDATQRGDESSGAEPLVRAGVWQNECERFVRRGRRGSAVLRQGVRTDDRQHPGGGRRGGRTAAESLGELRQEAALQWLSRSACGCGGGGVLFADVGLTQLKQMLHADQPWLGAHLQCNAKPVIQVARLQDEAAVVVGRVALAPHGCSSAA